MCPVNDDRRYLPDASRVDRLPTYGGYGLLVLPVPLISAEAGLAEQVQAAVRAAGPVWLADAEEDTEKRRRGNLRRGESAEKWVAGKWRNRPALG